MSNWTDKDVDLSRVNPKLRARSIAEINHRNCERQSKRTPMDNYSWLDNSNKRMNAELYESTNNKSNQTTLGKNNATTPKKSHCRI